MTAPELVCEWFANCTNIAAGVVIHPILHAVPTCQRCADNMEQRLHTWDEVEIVPAGEAVDQ